MSFLKGSANLNRSRFLFEKIFYLGFVDFCSQI